MTSELQGSKELVPPQEIAQPPSSCLCCLHFAVDFDVMPQLLDRKRPTRHPKRHVNS